MIAPVLGCREVARFADAYVDGELDPSAVLSIDAHVAGCAICDERLSLLRSMKRAVRAESSAETAPASLRARLARSAAALHEEALPVAKSTRVAAHPANDRSPPSWRSALPWAAAAAAAIAVGGGVRGYRSPDSANSLPGTNAATRAQILEEFALQHARPLPPEELDPARVTKVFSPIVGVPVRPIRLADVAMANDLYRFNFAGARLMALRDEPAATLFYERAAGNGRVTVFVYDPNRISVRSACCLEPRIVRAKGEDRTILVGHAKGYSLAVAEHDGVGYALSSDIAEDEVVELAAGM